MASSPNDGFTDTEPEISVKRRRRGANACDRCKSRKQRCVTDPGQESGPCRRCKAGGLRCSRTMSESDDPGLHTYCRARIHALEDRLRLLDPTSDLLDSVIHTLPSPSVEVKPATLRRVLSHSAADPRADDGREDDALAAGVALLSLNAANEPIYLRASSGHFWAKVVSGSFKGPTSPLHACDGPIRHQQLPPPPPQTTVNLPDQRTSSVLLDACYNHTQSRYAFLDWISVKKWVNNQEQSVFSGTHSMEELELETNKDKRVSSFFVWIVYAIGARLLQGRPTPGLSIADPSEYYAAAMIHLDVVIRLHNLHNVQAFLLLTIFSIWSIEGTSAWYLIGMAMRIALDLGLHRRRTKPKGTTRYAEELRKRTWWGLYSIDRWLSLTLGRPVGISDQDIDQELPANVTCDVELPDVLAPTTFPGLHLTPYTFTSSSSALQMYRLRRIESDIHQAVHVVESRTDLGLQTHHWRVLEELDRWKASICLPPPGTDRYRLPCLSKTYFELKAETARLVLLRPFVATAKPGDAVLALTGKSAAEVCHHDRSLLQLYPQSNSLCFSDLHGTFLTGLTLLSVLWIDPNALAPGEAHKAVRACSNSLFIYAQHFKEAVPFGDAFEELANVCLDNRAGAPDPSSYRSAVSLVGFLNRPDQGSMDYGPLFNHIQNGGKTAATQAQAVGMISENTTPWNGQSLAENDDPEAVQTAMGSTPDFQSMLMYQEVSYPQNSSITDIFNQLLGGSTPWNGDDAAGGTLDINQQLQQHSANGIMLTDSTGFFGDLSWSED